MFVFVIESYLVHFLIFRFNLERQRPCEGYLLMSKIHQAEVQATQNRDVQIYSETN